MTRKFSFWRLLLAGVAFASTLLLSTAQTLQAQPDFEFANQWGNSNPIDFVEITSMTTNNAGEQIIVGQFEGNIDFDPGAGTYILSSVDSTKDIFVLKLDWSGGFVWAGKIGNDIFSETIWKVVTDNADNIYICGSFSGNIPFDFNSGFYLNSGGSETGFVAKYNPAGGIIYAKMIGEDLNPNNSTSLVKSIAVDKVTEELYMTGDAKGYVDLDPDGGVFSFSTSGGGTFYSVFTGKLTVTGNILWADTFATTNHSFSSDIFLGADNNVYSLGSFYGNASPVFVNPAQGSDIYLFKMDQNGSVVWKANMGGAGTDMGFGLAGDNNYVYVTGEYVNSFIEFNIDAGGMSLPLEGYVRGFLYQINFAGSGIAVKSIGFSSGDTHPRAITANSNGIYVGGFYTIITSANGGGTTLNAAGAVDGFVYKFNTSTDPLWGSNIGGNNDDGVVALAIGSNERLHISGKFNSPVLNVSPSATNYDLLFQGGTLNSFCTTWRQCNTSYTSSLPAPSTPIASGDTIFLCVGESVTLESLVAYDTSAQTTNTDWYINGGYISTGSTQIFSHSGSYAFNTIMAAPCAAGPICTGCYQQQTFYVVYKEPLMTSTLLSVDNSTPCSGSPFHISTNCGSCDPGVSYSWYVNPVTSSTPVDSAGYVIANGTPGTSFNYAVTASYNGCYQTAYATVTLANCTAQINYPTSNGYGYYCAGDILVTEAISYNITNPTYVWDIDSYLDTSATAAYLTDAGFWGPLVVNLSVYEGGYFITSVTDTVQIVRPYITLSPSGYSFCPGTPDPEVYISNLDGYAGCYMEIYDIDGTYMGIFNNPLDTFYPNAAATYYAKMQGCDAISNIISLYNDSVAVNLVAVPNDTICGSSTTLVVSSDAALPSYYWSNLGYSSFVNPVTLGGNYTVTVTNGITGCTGVDSITIYSLGDSLSLSPAVSSFCPTSPPPAITITTNCVGCQVAVYDINDVLQGNYASFPAVFYPSVAGIYYAEIVGCGFVSNSVQVTDATVNTNISAIPNDTFCVGDVVTLVASCDKTNPTYTWSHVGLSASIQTINATGTYMVTTTDTSTGCYALDSISVYQVPNVLVSLSAYSPMQTTDTAQNLATNIVFNPAAPLGGGFGGIGVSGDYFYPNVAGAGTHIVNYSYTESVCTYSLVDTIVVNSNTTSINFTNQNTASTPYQNSEACVGDTLYFSLNNVSLNADEVMFSNGAGGYTTPVAALNVSYVAVGSNWSGSFRVVVPADARTGTLRLRKNSSGTTLDASALIVNRPDVNLVGLPANVCSSGDYPLTTLPSGGTLSATYQDNNASAPVFLGNILDGGLISGYNSTTGQRGIIVTYAYTPRYGGGAGAYCPVPIIAVDTTLASHTGVDTITFFAVGASETAAPIDSILDTFTPDTVVVYTTRNFTGTYVSGTAPNFYFNAKAAGVGNHVVTCQVSNGACTENQIGIVQVIAAPSLLGLQGQYCNNAATDTLYRAAGYTYTQTSTATLTTYTNTMVVSATNYIGSMGPFGGPDPNTEFYLFDPGNVSGGSSIVSVIYRTTLETYNANPPYNLLSSRSYVVGHAVDTIIIGGGATVNILDSVTYYCETNSYQLIRVTPTGGVFSIEQLNGIGAGAITTQNPNPAGEVFLNPYTLHQSETADVNYLLTYTYTSAGCTNDDVLTITIPEPAVSTFYTLSGNTDFCKSDPIDSLIGTVAGGTFYVDGFINATARFNPATLSASPHIVRYANANSYGCINQSSDTLTVYALPTLSWSTTIANRYCEDAPIFSIGANPMAVLPSTGTLTVTTNQGTQTVGNPFNFDAAALLANNLVPDTISLLYSYTDANGCSNTLTKNTILSPLPAVSMTNLEPVYCAGNPAVGLYPSPTGGSLTCTPTTTNLNLATGVYTPTSVTATQYITYTYTDGFGCTTIHLDTTSVISVTASVSITQGMPNQTCFTGDTFNIIATPVPATPGVYFTSNAGGIVTQNANTAQFVPNQAAVGDVVITYTYTASGCSKTAMDTVNIRPLPDLSMIVGTNIDSICEYYPAQNISVYDNNYFPPQLLSPSPNLSVTGTGSFLAGSIYRFAPDSAQIGWNVLTTTYVDAFGCLASINDSLKVILNPYPYLSGLQSSYCNNETMDTVIALPQGGTWSPTGGSSPLTVPSGAAYAVFDPMNPSASAGTGITNVSYAVTYSNGCQNTTTVPVHVSAPPVLAFTSPTNGQQFCENSPLQALTATVNNNPVPASSGVFYDFSGGIPLLDGVLLDSFFNPAATTGGRNIYFSYQDPASGCTATTSVVLNVLPIPEANISSLQTSYCINNPPDTIYNNSLLISPIASAAYSTASGQGVTAIASYNALLDPNVMGIGLDTVFLTITDMSGCTDVYMQEVVVRDLPSGLFINLADSFICENESIIPVSGFPSGVGGKFYVIDAATQNIVDSNDVNINLNPPQYGIGIYELVFLYQDQNYCSSQISKNIEIHPKPYADYFQTGFCEGDTMTLHDQSYFLSTMNTLDTITQWQWTYKGFLSATNQPFFSFPNEPSGWSHAMLVVGSDAGCNDTLSSSAMINSRIGDTVKVYNVPFANFNMVGGCQYDQVLFSADSAGLEPFYQGVPFDKITDIVWNFGNGDSVVISNGTSINISAAAYTYQLPGVYFPFIKVTNNGLCHVADTARLVISPTVNPYPVAYAQDFELDNGLWFNSHPDAETPWEWGVATGNTINTANTGNHVWKTDLDTYYSDGQASWVFGPCFNFTQSVRPMIKLDYFSDMYDFDGVVLEYYDKNDDKWYTIGESGAGVNWYNNDVSIFGLLNFKPLLGGVQLDGWTGQTAEWQTGRYRLDNLKGKNFVRLRMAMGTLAGVINDEQREGFAFDNVWVGERTRNVLVEYFSNFNTFNIIYYNNAIYGTLFNNNNGADIAFIEYHQEGDFINDLNAADHNSRFLLYGATPTQAVVDGNAYQGPANLVTQQTLDMDMLQDPSFLIPHDSVLLSVAVDNNGDAEIRLRGRVEAIQNMPLDNYTVYAAIVEDSIFQLGVTMQSVLRKFVPDHGAFDLERNWLIGDYMSFDETWFVNDFNQYYIKEHIQGLVFIQNEISKTVYQVGTTRDFDFYLTNAVPHTSEGSPILPQLKVFPIPSSDFFNVAFDEPLNSDFTWQLMDLRGVTIQSGTWSAGTLQQTVNTYDLPSGVYLLGASNPHGSVYLQRKVVINKP